MSDLINAMKTLLKYYEKALKNEYVQKKVLWALYQTWKFYDAIEKEQKNDSKRCS